MKFSLTAAGVATALLLSFASFAEWPKQPYVQIQGAPESELCRSAATAVDSLRNKLGELYGTFRDPRTRAQADLAIAGLTFHPVKVQRFTVTDAAGKQRPDDVAYYLLDIDNDGAQDMITLLSGGHGAAGEGDTLFVLEKNLSAAPQPIPRAAFDTVALEIGGRTQAFRTQDGGRFDPAYFLYPFAFQGRNYLLVDGNRADDPKHLVVEAVPDNGVVTRCSSDVR